MGFYKLYVGRWDHYWLKTEQSPMGLNGDSPRKSDIEPYLGTLKSGRSTKCPIDPKFRVYAEKAVRYVTFTRNRESKSKEQFRTLLRKSEVRSPKPNPTRPNRPDPTRPDIPNFVPRLLPYGENNTQCLNSLYFEF